MPSVDTQSRLSKNNSELRLHNSTGSSNQEIDLVRSLSQSRELREQDVSHGKEIKKEREIEQSRDKHQEIDLVRSLSQSRELREKGVLHGKEIKEEKEIEQSRDKHQEIDLVRSLSQSRELREKGVLHGKEIKEVKEEREIQNVKVNSKEFYPWARSIMVEWTKGMMTGWTRNTLTERWSTLFRTGNSEQGHERSQERGKSQPFSGRRVLHPLKSLLVTGLLLTSGNIQGAEAGWFRRRKYAVYSKTWYGGSRYVGIGEIRTTWYGKKYIKLKKKRGWFW